MKKVATEKPGCPSSRLRRSLAKPAISHYPAPLPVAVAALLAMARGGDVCAAPFIDVFLEGAVAGSGNWTNTLGVQSGQTYDYRVRFKLAPVGTTNTNPTGTVNDTINSYTPSTPASTSNGL